MEHTPHLDGKLTLMCSNSFKQEVFRPSKGAITRSLQAGRSPARIDFTRMSGPAKLFAVPVRDERSEGFYSRFTYFLYPQPVSQEVERSLQHVVIKLTIGQR